MGPTNNQATKKSHFSIPAKRILVSVAAGILLTFATGGLKFYVFDKPNFDPRAACKSSRLQASLALCDPLPYIYIGFPWAYGVYSDASGSSRVLSFSGSSEYEGTKVGDDYAGFVADTVLYSLIAFCLLEVMRRVKARRS